MQLTEWLYQDLTAGGPPENAAATDGSDPEQMLSKVDQISDEQVDSMLGELIAERAPSDAGAS